MSTAGNSSPVTPHRRRIRFLREGHRADSREMALVNLFGERVKHWLHAYGALRQVHVPLP